MGIVTRRTSARSAQSADDATDRSSRQSSVEEGRVEAGSIEEGSVDEGSVDDADVDGGWEAQQRRVLEAAQRGDAEALEALVETHAAPLFGYLRARLLEAADAEDLCQELFLRVYAGRARLPESARVRPWLVGVARNLLREHVRRVRRRREVAWTELCLELELLAEPEDGLYDDLLEHLPDCLAALGPSARTALELHYRDRLRLAAIGEKLRRSTGAVKLLMYRGRQAVQRCLRGKAARGA